MKIYIDTPLNNARKKIYELKNLSSDLEQQGADITKELLKFQHAARKRCWNKELKLCITRKEINRDNLLAAYEEYFIAAEKELNK